MKKIILFVLTLCATGTLFAQTFAVNGINYNVTSPTTVEVGLNPDFTGAAVIPNIVSNENVVYEVTRIGSSAFQVKYNSYENPNGVKSIIIPNTVTSIGKLAFYDCYALTSVTIPNSVISIESSAFFNCVGLTSVIIPNSVKSIGFEAFRSCYSLSSVNLPEGLVSIGDGAFYQCALTSITIPNSVNTINPGTFFGCTRLTSVNIPNSVITIGNNAFADCEKLTSTIIPNSVKTIGSQTFIHCTSLTSINIPNSVTSIEEEVFAGCSILKSVTVNWATPLAINANVFDALPLASATLYVPFGTLAAYKAAPVWKDFGNIIESTFIASGINYKVTSLTTVEVGNNTGFTGDAIIPTIVTNAGRNYTVTRIGDNAFFNNSKLKSISIPNTVTYIGAGAFYGCWGLMSLVIPEFVDTVGGSAFYGCYGLSIINIPNSVNTFGSEASGLTPVIGGKWGQPDGSFGDMVTNGCNGSTFIIPVFFTNTETSINEGKYAYCNLVSSANIPESIKSIGVGAFSFCTGLKSVSIPKSITSIGGRAFHNCNDLKTVIVNWSTPLIIDSLVFGNTNIASATLNVPFGTLAAYQAAPVWKDFGTIIEMQPITFTYQGINFKVTSPTTVEVSTNPGFTGVLNIPSSITYEGITYDVTSIVNNAFAGSGVTSINIPNAIITIGDYAFANLTGLTAVTVNWTNPLVINANVFGNLPVTLSAVSPTKTLTANNTKPVVFASTNIASVTLYVPATTLAAYKAAPVWKNFGTIIEQVTLPLTLTNFTAKATTTGNQINWATANVINVKNIILERSGTDKNFSYLVTLPITATQYIDTNPLAGDNYYRLSTTDNVGSPNTYTQVAYVKGLNSEITFYPNPITNGELNVVAGAAKLQSVVLYDLNGNKVVLVNSLNSPNKVVVSTQGLAKGVYLLEISSEKSKIIKKVVVN